MVGYMPMPADFSYRTVFELGRPQHRKFDDFWLRHPTMDPGHRAKIFSPFDALKGFSEAVESKEVRYETKLELSQQRIERIEETLGRLHSLTINGRVARENNVEATVEYYVPCTDRNHEAYGVKGRYLNYSGTVHRVDSIHRRLFIGDLVIGFDDIYDVHMGHDDAADGRNDVSGGRDHAAERIG